MNSVCDERVPEVVQLEAEAGVGPVDPEPRDGLGERHPRPRRWRHGELRALEHRAHHRLGQLDHVVLVDERHLDVELGELGLAVGACVLVAEAASDLVVALEPADHQQLLEQLRRLRERVERPWLDSRGNQVVARALRGRAGQVGRLDLEEVPVVEDLPHRRDHPVPQRERVLHRLASQVERAVAQPEVLVDRLPLVERERRRVRVGQQLELGGRHLDLAGRDVRVDVLGVPARDRSGDRDHVLRAQPVGGRVRVGRGIGVEYQLHDSRAIPQVDEDQAAVVAAAVHPPGDPCLGTGAVARHLPAPRVAVAVRPGRVLHVSRLPRRIVGITSPAGSSR